MLLRWFEFYANTDVLSPIDRRTWQAIGKTCNLGQDSKVIELASGKGAFAVYLAEKFGCDVDGYEINPEFVQYAVDRSKELGLEKRLRFTNHDVNQLSIKHSKYDLGACLGALYIFRDIGWKILTRTVKQDGYLAVSEMYAKKLPAPKPVMDVFFEESSKPWTLEDARNWYGDRGMEVLKEEECSRKAWLDYYELTKEMLVGLRKKYFSDRKRLSEIREGLKEDGLARKYGEKYLGYVTFIMRKSS